MSPLVRYLLETLLTVGALLALLLVVLFAGRALRGRSSGPLRLVGSLPLEGRRSVYLVQVGELVLVVGASEAGLAKLAELPASAVPEPTPPAPAARFSDVLARLRGAKAPERGAVDATDQELA